MIKKYKDYFPEIHPTCFSAENSTIIGDVIIGRNSSVWYNAVLRGDMAGIRIGENTNIQDGCILHCVENVEVNVGNNVTVGHNAVLHSCSIGDNSLIGMGAIILDNVIIGKNCLVGAGALVTPYTEIPDGSMVLGSPAKVKRQLTEEEIAQIRRNSEVYVKLASE